MARIRPWRCHRNIERPYTRISRIKRYNYVSGAPQPRIRALVVGKKEKNTKEWKYAGHIVAETAYQISDSALESLRIYLNRKMDKTKSEYLLVVRKYPHHVIRENPIAYGAGADRISKGMRLAFGKPVRRAAQVYPGDAIFSIYFDNEKLFDYVKDILRVVKCKLPGNYKIYVGENTANK